MRQASRRRTTVAKPKRAARLEARISQVQKELFVRAAELQGRSLTDFVISSAVEAAQETVRAHESLRLSEADRRTFVSALLSPPAPTKALVRAVKRYREKTGL